MIPKFKVRFDVQERFESNQDLSFLEHVIPESLSLQCPHCGVYPTVHLEASVKRGMHHLVTYGPFTDMMNENAFPIIGFYSSNKKNV